MARKIMPCFTVKTFSHLSPLLTYSIFAAMKPNKIQVVVMVVMVVMVVAGKVMVVTGKGGANMGMNANINSLYSYLAAYKF